MQRMQDNTTQESISNTDTLNVIGKIWFENLLLPELLS